MSCLDHGRRLRLKQGFAGRGRSQSGLPSDDFKKAGGVLGDSCAAIYPVAAIGIDDSEAFVDLGFVEMSADNAGR